MRTEELMKPSACRSLPRGRPATPVLRRLAFGAGLGLTIAAGLIRPPAAGAHFDPAVESGLVQLDSATAVRREGASPLSWRSASPLAVPDQFGPGAVLSVGNVPMPRILSGPRRF